MFEQKSELLSQRQSHRHAEIGGRCLVLLGILTALIGCSKASGPQVVRVNGTVTYQGKPVANLLVTFMPTQGRPSHATTDANGHFDLQYTGEEKGAVVGRHTAWVSVPLSGAEGMGPQFEPKLAPEVSVIVKKYGTPDLTPFKDIEVKSDNQVVDLKLD